MYKYLIVFSLLFFVGCANDDKEKLPVTSEKNVIDTLFNKAKWNIKEDNTYVYRKYMMNDIVYNDTIRDLNKQQILNLLGKPNREKENYYYYMVEEKRLLFWPLHTTMMVFKFNDNDEVDWIKIHK